MKKELMEIFRKNKKLTFDEICTLVKVYKKNDRYRVADALESLVRDGKIIMVGEYFGFDKYFELFEGTIVIKESGYGFFTSEALDGDIFIPAHLTMDAFTGDTVVIGVYERIFRGKMVKEGAVCRILKRGFVTVVGTFDGNRIVNDDRKNPTEIIVPKSKRLGAVKGHKVLAKILEYKEGCVIAEIVKILGHENDPKMDIISYIYRYNIPLDFPDEVIEEANSLPDVIDTIDARMDYRDLLTITIDGDDAKDLDDAISLVKTDDGYTLYVHIADVSYYVTDGSALDKEAYLRGTSVYLANTVVPMIPHRLSNGICSLNEHEDRYTLTAVIEYDLKGKVLKCDIYESVINSNHRMTYRNVNKMLDGIKLDEYADISTMILNMNELAQILKKRRISKGSIEFDSQESKIICDEYGVAIDVKPYDRGVSESIIEEFMLAANVCIANAIRVKDWPFIYRVHENPDPLKLENMLKILNSLGIKMKKKAEDINQFDIQKLLSMVPSDRKYALSNVMLRSMMKARYSKDPLGHYGLAFPDYTHFTSPIRRYPDLMVHRLLRLYLFNHDFSRMKYYNNMLSEIALSTSRCEKRSVDCERDVIKMKQAEYMASHIGEVYTGYISGITRFGVYVCLPNTVEGLVSINSIDGEYEFDEEKMMFRDKKGHKHLHIGDNVIVKAVRASKEASEIDFELEGDTN